MTEPTTPTESFADLLARLRQELQLDATTDVLPGTVNATLSNDAVLATTPGTVTHKIALRDGKGNLVGYLPIYDHIT